MHNAMFMITGESIFLIMFYSLFTQFGRHNQGRVRDIIMVRVLTRSQWRPSPPPLHRVVLNGGNGERGGENVNKQKIREKKAYGLPPAPRRNRYSLVNLHFIFRVKPNAPNSFSAPSMGELTLRPCIKCFLWHEFL